MTELAQVRSMVELALRRLDELHKLLTPKRAPLTRAAFAKLTGYSVRTIQRKTDSGEIKVDADNRIPASELDRFLT